MDYPKILQGILDVGEEMLRSGAENFRIDDSLYRICKSYGFIRYDVFVIPSNIQITVETPEGEILTQVRHIESTSINYDRLDYLNNLSRYLCANTPDAAELHEKFMEVMNRPQQHPAIEYIASVMGGAGFGVFFGCDLMDTITATIISLMIVVVGKWLGKRENNLLIYNTILAFLSEVIILLGVKAGLGLHPGRIMIGIVMLLISALGITNGLRELIQRDFLSGSLNIMNSVLGASGIVFGIYLAILLIGGVSSESYILASSVPLQLISCTIACTGFALIFKIKGKQVLYSTIGAFFTWAVYLVAYEWYPSNFVATLAGGMFVFLFAYIMSRVNKAPSTIFLTATMFPLIPGANLYYMMYGILVQNIELLSSEALMLVSTCLAIAAGFLVMDILIRVSRRIFRLDPRLFERKHRYER